MHIRPICLAICSYLASAVPASAQVVQLPTFQFFTVNTSVSVPDRGGAYLGGLDRSSSGAQHFHLPLLPGQSARGIGHSAQGMSVQATMHDLGGPPTGSASIPVSAEQEFAQRLTAASRAQIPRAARAGRAEAVRDEREARRFLERGDQARDAGKLDVARVYYELAARRATAELALLITERLTALHADDGSTIDR